MTFLKIQQKCCDWEKSGPSKKSHFLLGAMRKTEGLSH